MRKLAVYNFTIYETASNNGFCYIWDETEGKRGANEIATALLDYAKSLPDYVTSITSFSDTCAGQNRNQFIAAAMLYAVQVTHVTCIDLKYMESGHSYLEADSMHSTIEKSKRHQKIYTTREWEVLIAGARKNPRPYTVRRLMHDDFFDLKLLSNQIIQNRTRNINGDVVKWLKIKWMRFDKAHPYTIQYKYTLSSDTFMELNIHSARGRRATIDAMILQPAYKSRLPIAMAKRNDLMRLVKSRVIPPDYATWYNSLPASANVRDNLPEPTADELADINQTDDNQSTDSGTSMILSPVATENQAESAVTTRQTAAGQSTTTRARSMFHLESSTASLPLVKRRSSTRECRKPVCRD
jgi:hypothetical protein